MHGGGEDAPHCAFSIVTDNDDSNPCFGRNYSDVICDKHGNKNDCEGRVSSNYKLCQWDGSQCNAADLQCTTD